MCLARLPVDRDRFHCIPLYDEVPVVVVPLEHLVTAADEVTLSDLADEQLVLPHASGWTPDAPQLDFPEMDAKDAIEVVASGTGVVIVPSPWPGCTTARTSRRARSSTCRRRRSGWPGAWTATTSRCRRSSGSCADGRPTAHAPDTVPRRTFRPRHTEGRRVGHDTNERLDSSPDHQLPHPALDHQLDETTTAPRRPRQGRLRDHRGDRRRVPRLGLRQHRLPRHGLRRLARVDHGQHRLALRPHLERVRRVRAVAGDEPLRHHPARPRRRGAGVPDRLLGRDDVQRRHGHRPDVLRRQRADQPLRDPAPGHR